MTGCTDYYSVYVSVWTSSGTNNTIVVQPSGTMQGQLLKIQDCPRDSGTVGAYGLIGVLVAVTSIMLMIVLALIGNFLNNNIIMLCMDVIIHDPPSCSGGSSKFIVVGDRKKLSFLIINGY